MANITPRKNKHGEIISYRIRVARGYDSNGKKIKPYEMTWRPAPNMTSKQIQKEVQKQAVLFEEQCRQGLTGDGRQKFDTYAEYVIELKEKSGELRHNTALRYRELLERVNQGIGHIRLVDLRSQHLNKLYEQLAQSGLRKNSGKAVLKSAEKLLELMPSDRRECFIREQAELSVSTYRKALRGGRIALESAVKLSSALNVNTENLFDIEYDSRPLSNKTIREHHVLIHLILEQAVCEMLIPYNPADRAKPPKVEQKTANYFEQDEVDRILECAESEPLKWRMLLHLLLVTGGRRGEVLGLTWDCIDWEYNKIHIEKCVYYSADVGVYIDKPKTEKSVRYIKLHPLSMKLLKQYYTEYYQPLKSAYGDKWHNTGFIFVRNNGEPMHPDSVTGYCKRFSEKYGLKHINPHAFRHTAASLLYFAGMDTISISNHLGHAKASTTQNIYAHVIAEAESRIAECMGGIILSHNSNTKTG